MFFRLVVAALLSTAISPAVQTQSGEVSPRVADAMPDDSSKLFVRFARREAFAAVPVEFVKGLILFQARINGKQVTVLLDNGTQRTVIDTAFAQGAGIELGRKAGDAFTGVSRISTRLAGPVTFEVPGALTIDGEVLAFDLGPISKAVGRPVHAVLGGDALHRMAFVVQPEKRELSIVPSGSIRLEGPDVVRIPIGADAHVEALINGKPVRMAIDFGHTGVAAVTDEAWGRVFGPNVVEIGRTTYTLADGEVRASRIARADLKLGALTAQNVRILSGFISTKPRDGILGTDLFLHGTAVMDVPRGEMILLVPRQQAGAKAPTPVQAR
ncbi:MULTISPECIES: aspartyl protease family protein [unclassified Sphingomonas]|jgi:predicted aspartyl protease|uniref:aspartyl protease family protein n=1 Tax=unclassified Sphingomonas TaxID=196159 RepID=UPI00082D39AD|nr:MULTISPECIES: aspartyl protease family protein [unclassified Sphingomonas]